MKSFLIKNFDDIPTNIQDLSLVFGLFDGVHKGHQGLINYSYKNSKNKKIGVLTFDKALKETSCSLMSLEDKKTELSKLPIDYLFILVCDENLKRMSHETFLNLVLKKLKPSTIFCGSDFRFGYKALGDVAYLKEHFSNVNGFDFVEDDDGNKISSRSIKDLISNGEIEKANNYLTRPFQINGKVVSGLHNGHDLGFPTANISPDINYVLPKNGVYFTKIELENKKIIAVTNIGVHPSISKLDKPIIEAHIIGENEDLYNKNVKLYIYKKERDEINFKNLEELKKQIQSDKENCIKYFSKSDLHK